MQGDGSTHAAWRRMALIHGHHPRWYSLSSRAVRGAGGSPRAGRGRDCKHSLADQQHQQRQARRQRTALDRLNELYPPCAAGLTFADALNPLAE